MLVDVHRDDVRGRLVEVGLEQPDLLKADVHQRARRRVEEAAKKLGYQVNSYARGLKTNKTYSVALIWPSIRHPFFATLADELTAVLMQQGYRAVLMITNYDPEAEQKCITMVRQNKVDGIIALTYNPALEVDESIPFVTIDRRFSDKVPCISSDNFGGGQMAAEKLIELGCQKLLFLRIGSDVYSEVDKRRIGFESVCRERNIPFAYAADIRRGFGDESLCQRRFRLRRL